MSKVICDVCGTSYPETSAQCPICGCVHTGNAATVSNEVEAVQAAGTYQYVKGGRFSKANVRKRNAGKQAPVRSSVEKSAVVTEKRKSAPKKKSKNSGNTGLVITIFVLLLAILAVIGYIVVKFFIPSASAEQDPVVDTPAIEAEDNASVTDPVILCEDLVLDNGELYLYEIGEQAVLSAVPSPADTTEKVVFSSYDEAVATVDEAGNIIAVGYGDTVISVTCGTVSVQCNISVEERFVLDTESLSFTAVGAYESIYSGELPLDEISWQSENEAIAVVADGVVTSVGNGSTKVVGTYKSQTVTCAVTCETVEETTSTEATASDVAPGPYKLKNLLGGSTSDVSLNVGEKFELELRDANGAAIEDAVWSVDGKSVTVEDGLVKAVRSGYSEVTVTYNGESFTCVVRVR